MRKNKCACLLMVAGMVLTSCKAGNGNSQTAGETTNKISNVVSDTEIEKTEAAYNTAGEENVLDNTENKELNVTETVADDGLEQGKQGVIVEKCPVSASDTRKDVVYGEYVHETYFSKTAGRERGMNVLLPKNYSEEKKYPVLYLLHGIFGDENSFPSDPNNKVKEIFYNLCEDGLSREWIVIMPSMFVKTSDDQKPEFNAEALKPYDLFLDDLVNDLMPYVNEKYSVLEGRENTAIAGFSLGGRQTLYISLSRPDLFAYAGAISPAPGLVKAKDWAMEHPGLFLEDEIVYPKADEENAMKVLMVMCGDSDKVVGKFPKSYHELFEKNAVEHIWYEVAGADHDNTAIKSGLYNFLVQVGK